MNSAERVQAAIAAATVPVRVRLHDSSEVAVDGAVLHDDIDGTYVLILLEDDPLTD